MQIRISKKIILYLFILFILGTPYNKMLLEINFKNSNGFEISSLSNFDDTEIINELSNFKNED